MSSTAGLDFNKVYTSGTIILLNPVQSNSIFFVAACLCSSIEYLFDISGDVDSTYYQDLFEVITEEALVFGIVQLFMVFLSSLTNLSDAWAIMFQWGQLLMMSMAFFLTVFVLLVASNNAAERGYWKTFETMRMRSSAAVSMFTGKEKLYARCVNKFRVTLMAYDYPMSAVHFCDYIGVVEKKYVVKLMDLSWKSWLSMMVTATFNSLRAGLLKVDKTETSWVVKMWPVVTYVLFEGIAPLLVYVYLDSLLGRRLYQYLELGAQAMEARLKLLDENAAEPDESKHHEVAPFRPADLQDPQSFLIWQSLDVSLTLVQISILQIVWFYSNAVLTIYGSMFLDLNIGAGFILFMVTLLPGLVLWRFLSWTITLMAMMSSLEVAADRKLIDELCGITKEMRAEAETAKEEEEKKRKEAEEKAKREAEGLPEAPPMELDDEGRVKVVKRQRRPVELDDDIGMSRIALDRRQALDKYEELEGHRL